MSFDTPAEAAARPSAAAAPEGARAEAR